MKEKLLMIGAGGHARSVIDVALLEDRYDIIGCIDKEVGKDVAVAGIKVVGCDSDTQRFFDKGIVNIFVAIGNNLLRHSIASQLSKVGFNLVNIISPVSYVSKYASLGTGICVMHGAVINVNTSIADNCIINTNSSIDHDCKIGHSVHIAPGVALSGSVNIGDFTHIGTGASVIDGSTVGRNVYAGAGSVIVCDIESDKLVYGVPAKIIKDNR